MTLPARYNELIDRCWEALQEGPDGVDVALVHKGPVSDLFDGLSDLDFRIVLGTRDTETWRWADDVFYRVFKEFAYAFPDSWRLVEHAPGRGLAIDELYSQTSLGEFLEWELLRESKPNTLPAAPALDETMRHMYLEKFYTYRDPYDATRDPAINVAPEHIDRFPLFSICWHFYVPALRCAAMASGIDGMQSKWEALRWRAEAGSDVAARVLAAAENDFAGPAADLAERCSQDVQSLACELTGSDDPWTAIGARIDSSRMPEQERLILVVLAGRMATGRWRFYTEAPEGYDLSAVLRIDRGHLKNYLLGPILHDDGPEKLLAHAPDAEAHQRGVDFVVNQMSATDLSQPREVFQQLMEHYAVVREAIEGWYGEAG
jgi:hypothetical protein